MEQEVSRRPLTGETPVRSQGSKCGICGGESCISARISSRTIVFPLPVSFHQLPNNDAV